MQPTIRRISTRNIILALLTLSFLFVGAGCQNGETQSGEGPLIFRVTDAPADVAHLWVTLEQVSTRPCRGGGWTDLPTVTTSFDLIALAGDDAFRTINEAALTPYGSYCETRLMLGEEASVETTGGETYTLKIPSREIKIKGEYEVGPSTFTIVTLDFDVDESLHRAGNSGKYIINPVIFVEDIRYEPMEIGEEHYEYLMELYFSSSDANKMAKYMSMHYDWRLPDCQYGRSYAFDPENDPETFLFLMCAGTGNDGTFGQYILLVSEWFPEEGPGASVFEFHPDKGVSLIYISESGAVTDFPLPTSFPEEGMSAFRENAPDTLKGLPIPVNQLNGEEN